MVFRVQRFEYSGFSGITRDGLTDYSARFIEWTPDPGVGLFQCSDGPKRLIPTFALLGRKKHFKLLPKQPKTGVLFGAPSNSD